jgi:hypothetical protein
MTADRQPHCQPGDRRIPAGAVNRLSGVPDTVLFGDGKSARAVAALARVRRAGLEPGRAVRNQAG